MTKTPKWGADKVTEAMFGKIPGYEQSPQSTGESASLKAGAKEQVSDRTSCILEGEGLSEVSLQQAIKDAGGDFTS